MLIALGSFKASPGVTTAALALAAMWPGEQRVVLVEVDPAGGDLAARFALEPAPGLVSLSAAARREHGVQVAFDHAQLLPGGLPVIAAPATAEQAGGALELLTGDGLPLWANLADDPQVVVIADCGRLDPGSPAHRIVAAADLALLVARPSLDECDRLAKGLDALAVRAEATGTQLGLVLSGLGFGAAEVQESMRMRVWAHLPHDSEGAAALSGTAARHGLGSAVPARAVRSVISLVLPGGERGLAGFALPKAARELAAEIAAHHTLPDAVPELGSEQPGTELQGLQISRSAA